MWKSPNDIFCYELQHDFTCVQMFQRDSSNLGVREGRLAPPEDIESRFEPKHGPAPRSRTTSLFDVKGRGPGRSEEDYGSDETMHDH